MHTAHSLPLLLPPPQQLSAEEHYENAEMAFAMEAFDQARSSFKRALDMEPEVRLPCHAVAAGSIHVFGCLPAATLGQMRGDGGAGPLLHLPATSPCTAAAAAALARRCALHIPSLWRDGVMLSYGEQSLRGGPSGTAYLITTFT